MQIEEYPVPNECPCAWQFIPLSKDVLWDSRLKPAEKIFFAEIVALSNNTGYCYATNVYFQTLNHVSTSTVQNWIASLKKYGYVKVELILDNNNAVKERRITPYSLDVSTYPTELDDLPQISGRPSPKKPDTPPSKNWVENKVIENKVNRIENKREARPKSVEDVRAYCQERNNGINPERFYDYYETNGWMQNGKKPIKDWKACVRTWEHNENKGPRPKGGTQSNGTSITDGFF